MSNNKKKRSPIGVLLFVVILMFAGVGGAYYFYVVYDSQPKESYAIEEKDSDVEEAVLMSGFGLDDGNLGIGIGGKAGTEGFFPSDNNDEKIRKAFNVMNNSNAQFFINTDEGESETLTTTNEVGFKDVIPDYVDTASVISKATKNFLNKNAHSSDSPFIQEITFDGETPEEYYESRNLDITCDKITPKKIYCYRTEPHEYLIICDAEVTTNHCDGKSVFPKEGKTKNVKMGVMAAYEGGGEPSVVLMDVVFM